MAAHNLTQEEMREAVDALATFGSQTSAAQHLGIARATLQNRLHRANQFEIQAQKVEAIRYPAFVTIGDEDEPIADILARKRKGFEWKAKANADRQWFEIKVNETKPYGVLMFGECQDARPVLRGCRAWVSGARNVAVMRDWLIGLLIRWNIARYERRKGKR